MRNIDPVSVKYVNLELVAFNSVGDPVIPRDGRAQFVARLVGPIDRGQEATYDYEVEPLFYARTTNCLEVRRVVVEFFDGSKQTLVNDLVKFRTPMQRYRVRGECAVTR